MRPLRFASTGIRGVLMSVVLVCAFCSGVFGQYGGGKGKAKGPAFIHGVNKRHVGAGLGQTDSNGTSSLTVVVDVSEDTYVSEWDTETNYGNEENVRVGNGGLEYRGYLKFDLSRIPEGRSIISAKLRLTARLANVEGALVGAHYLEDDNWDEEKITWVDCPTDFSSEPTDIVEAHLDYVYWEVGNDVNITYNGDGVYSVVLKMCDDCYDKWAYFYSRDVRFLDMRPVLEVECGGDKYGGGSGTAGDPYLIYTGEQMSWIGDNTEDWDKHFRLMNDIDLSGYTGHQFHIISTDWQEPFTGVFDGNGHVIYNFTYSIEGFVNYAGLFGCLGTGSEVKNLGLMYPHVISTSGNGAGTLAGLLDGGVVRNCWARGIGVSGSFRAGGLVGQVYKGQLIDSYAESGEVLVAHSYGGGLVGDNNDQVIRCYSTCSVGGSGSWFGGLIGHDNGGSVTGSFWDKEASGMLYSFGGGIGKTTAQMQTQSTFTSAGWDFTTPVWTIDEGVDYPRLWWQGDVSVIKYGGGSGTAEEPYLIYTAGEMQEIGANPGDWGAHFKLMEDIDLSSYTGSSFNMIGSWGTPFTGVFDGNSHTISNFAYSSTGTTCIGIFGRVDDANAEIRDLGVVAPNVDGGTGWYVGALIGAASDATITGCYVENGSVSGDAVVGGLVGSTTWGTVTGCYVEDCSVSGDQFVGALAGWAYGGDVIDCHASGSVTGDSGVGGLVGTNAIEVSAEIKNCYATGSVVGINWVGGLVGSNGSNYTIGTISNSYAKGSVVGINEVGGLVGYNGSSAWISNCYSSGSVSADSNVGGLVGTGGGFYTKCFWDRDVNPDVNGIGNTTDPNVIGESTANMQTESTFTDAGWDFVGEVINGPNDIWMICERQDYPRLWWEEVDCGEYSGGSGTAEDP
ncbi:MAG: DNRLRE domain-containing protein, partial [Planctomycetota bacterium]